MRAHVSAYAREGIVEAVEARGLAAAPIGNNRPRYPHSGAAWAKPARAAARLLTKTFRPGDQARREQHTKMEDDT